MKVSPVGRIIPGDGATYHTVTFTVLTYNPEVQEIVENIRIPSGAGAAHNH